MKKAIIIGGGIGGLSIAARLLHKGFKVELYEKNNSIGGKTNTLKLGDFKFDLTASLLMIPNDYIDIFLLFLLIQLSVLKEIYLLYL